MLRPAEVVHFHLITCGYSPAEPCGEFCCRADMPDHCLVGSQRVVWRRHAAGRPVDAVWPERATRCHAALQQRRKPDPADGGGKCLRSRCMKSDPADGIGECCITAVQQASGPLFNCAVPRMAACCAGSCTCGAAVMYMRGAHTLPSIAGTSD